VGEASCACVPQRDGIGLHNEGGRKKNFYLLYLLACAFQQRHAGSSVIQCVVTLLDWLQFFLGWKPRRLADNSCISGPTTAWML
jgi:hypothetical protein